MGAVTEILCEEGLYRYVAVVVPPEAPEPLLKVIVPDHSLLLTTPVDETEKTELICVSAFALVAVAEALPFLVTLELIAEGRIVALVAADV